MNKLFEGVVVLDLTNNAAGPSATAMLGDYGAEVIKIEKPVYGDDCRHWAPFIDKESALGLGLCRNKKSVTLDTRKPEAIEVLKELVKKADVVVEAFRPGYMRKIGLSYEDLIKIKPDIIMASISGFGQDGPYGQDPGYDLIIQAMSGVMATTGFPDKPPVKAGFAVGDYVTGLTAFGAIASALYYKKATGEGQYIDVCLLESLVNLHEFTDAVYNGLPGPQRCGNSHPSLFPFGTYQGRDGDIVLCAVSDKLWKSLCALMNREDLANDPRYEGASKRMNESGVLTPVIEDWLKSFASIDEVIGLLKEAGIPATKVAALASLPDNPQIIARKMISTVKASAVSKGTIKMRSPVIHFSKTPGTIEFTPALGEHTDEVIKNHLPYDEERIAELKENKVFG